MSEKPLKELRGRSLMKRRIAPGIWEDMDGHIHWSITELLDLVDLEDTPENRAAVTEILRKQIVGVNPDVQIVYRDKPDDDNQNAKKTN